MIVSEKPKPNVTYMMSYFCSLPWRTVLWTHTSHDI